jgi:UDP-N-acetyl-D-glucosamine dehydrogenase
MISSTLSTDIDTIVDSPVREKPNRSFAMQVQSAHADQLLQKIESRDARIGIVGLGYVGLPLSKALLENGYSVIGFDVDRRKIDAIANGESYIQHLGDDFFKMLQNSDKFSASDDSSVLADADAILLCVPTPLGAHNDPDLSYVLDSTRMVAKILRPGQMVVLESTTYPGTTRNEMMPILEETGLACGKDYFLAYSPEREDPGSTGRSAGEIPKLVGGVDQVSSDIAMALYERVVAKAHQVSSAEVAESAKLLENIYRSVNIALVNEMKTVLSDMDIDIWEVVDAAKTKPFGFQAFYPGPGLGGHCIPIDPYYLTWKAKEVGRPTRFIELAGEVNTYMPRYVINRLIEALNVDGKSLRDARILVLGIAYKKNVDDNRETPAAEIIEQLAERGAEISYHDPHLPKFPEMRKYDLNLSSVALDAEMLAGTDCVLVVTDHDAVDYELVGKHAGLVVDTRNAMARVPEDRVKARVVKA